MNKSAHLIAILLLTFFLFSAEREVPEFSEKISFASGPEIFPGKWLGGEINAKATRIDSSYTEQSLRVLQKALQKYPLEIVTTYLNKIFVLNTLEFYGLRYGGTNSLSNIYLCNRGFSDHWLEMAFHAEFSSLLLRKNEAAFDKEKWIQQNDESVAYGNSGVEALKVGKTSIVFNEALAEKGFLYEYALSSFENDYNSIAENLMMNRDEFWELAKKYPRVMAKINIVIGFYKQIDKRIDFQISNP